VAPRRLLREGLRVLAERGCGEATLWVLDRNARARAFYEAHGFVHDGAAKHDAALAIDELRYRRPLAHLPAADSRNA
jgi:ribosomal protein S18 acetylase RimI-like enzyme